MPEGQINDEDGTIELIIKFRQNVDLNIAQSYVSTWDLLVPSWGHRQPGANSGMQNKVLPGNCRLRNTVVCQYGLKDFSLSCLFMSITYDQITLCWRNILDLFSNYNDKERKIYKC